MKTIKTTVIASILTLLSASAFAANPELAAEISERAVTKTDEPTQAVHVVKAPVLIDANPHGTASKTRRIVRVVKMPVETPVARDASMSTESQFVFKYGKNTNTKTFRPSDTASASMPNKYKK